MRTRCATLGTPVHVVGLTYFARRGDCLCFLAGPAREVVKYLPPVYMVVEEDDRVWWRVNLILAAEPPAGVFRALLEVAHHHGHAIYTVGAKWQATAPYFRFAED